MLEVLHIEGGTQLQGSVQISGAKNAALPLFAAALLTDQVCRIENVPDLSDTRFMIEILEHLGAQVESSAPGVWTICAKTLSSKAPYDLVRKMRASICLLGPLVGRLKHAEVSLPGGCVFGQRPIDLHLKGLIKLGCAVTVKAGYIHIDAIHMRGGYVFLGGRHGSTVLGTANILMAAALAPGVTCIESAACEPEIVDLCHMLVKMGAKIEGIGSHTLTITGVKELGGCTHTVIPDRIEAGTYLVAGAITGGDITVHGARKSHLGALLHQFEQMGIPADIIDEQTIRMNANGKHRRPSEVITLPHPGFPTDLQAQLCALLALTPGLSIITERIYPSRFMHVPELERMGASISVEGAMAVIHGKERLSGAPVMASDLRASVALVLAAMAAYGETWVQRIYHLDRGYEQLEKKLNALGARISRLPSTAMPSELQDSSN